MRTKILFATVAIVALSVAALAQPSVTVLLQSTQAGQSVQPGATVDWTIKAQVSMGDNQGLALISVNLVQDAANPEKFDIPYAGGVPALMAGFSRPAGISNPGEGGNTTGYVGVQRGTSPGKNLIQIGGGQNTFGQAGTTIGTDAVVDPAIGQPGPVIIASGSFPAPATEGAYTFRLESALANVLTAINPPPNFSPVTSATIAGLPAATFTFNVQTAPPICRGDCNCDGSVGFLDIDFFVAAIPNNQAGWTAMFLPGTPSCTFANCDVNGNGNVGFDDIDPFVALIPSACP